MCQREGQQFPTKYLSKRKGIKHNWTDHNFLKLLLHNFWLMIPKFLYGGETGEI